MEDSRKVISPRLFIRDRNVYNNKFTLHQVLHWQPPRILQWSRSGPVPENTHTMCNATRGSSDYLEVREARFAKNKIESLDILEQQSCESFLFSLDVIVKWQNESSFIDVRNPHSVILKIHRIAESAMKHSGRE